MKPTAEQARAITMYDRDLCVDAGAGSGKTSVLVEHILHVLEKRDADLSEIVAITFTEK
ncbi:MAG: UvrD-helicase domain-containing protein, partial [Candidatus Hydrogenedentes bacterium]|nr:UvrD-helicase domain-containing protein [Candidatus Hydrogenedentota bacterium]